MGICQPPRLAPGGRHEDSPRLDINTDHNQRYRRHSPSLPKNVVELTLIISRARTHLCLQGFHGQDFNPDINFVANKKSQMFDKQVLGDKSVLAKLHFHRHAFFDKVSLVVTQDGNMSVFLNMPLLIIGWHG